MKEEWKDIILDGEITTYSISNIGNILSKERRVLTWNRFKFVNRLVKEKILKPSSDNYGYKITSICGKMVKVHRLVAQAFIPNPDNLPIVNHINGVVFDNRVENLEWCTYSHNSKHAYDTGLKVGSNGESNGKSKITKEIALEIRDLIVGNKTVKEIVEILQISKGIIESIKRGNTWGHVTGIPMKKKRSSRHNGIHKRGYSKLEITDNNEIDKPITIEQVNV